MLYKQSDHQADIDSDYGGDAESYEVDHVRKCLWCGEEHHMGFMASDFSDFDPDIRVEDNVLVCHACAADYTEEAIEALTEQRDRLSFHVGELR